MYTLNIARAVKKMSVIEIREFIFENVYKRMDYSMKRLKRKDLLLLQTS